ncbi:MAG: TVP38/TMEM64 family protein [Synergistaceae bacterium]|nr:TVP38/TMEM64 family protein [Synergistaceae bacterium]
MKRFVKPVAFVVLLSAALMVAHHFGLSDRLLEAIPKLRELADESPFVAMAGYVVLTSFGCVVLAMPGAFFALAAGLLFEPLTGTLLCLVAATLGAVLAFLAGRYFLKDSLRPMLEKNKVLKKFLFDDVQHSGIILLMVTRLVPLFPYNLQNFAYGLTDIGLVPYTVYTFLFMAPGAAMFTLGAAGLGDAEKRQIYFFLALVLAIAVTVAGIILRKKFVRR